ncbi:hypothetical protein C8J56DRAFT_911096 [Mycena floridula]|nr:hypothetical protein C8J56DRAFT_911096 [Mycena floridula]
MSTDSRQLLSRLYSDLQELHESPYPGVAFFTEDSNLRKLCLVLTPPSGPWKDLALHFDVEIPVDWPSSPPQIRSSASGIEHPNLFGSYICCDLLKKHIYAETGYTGGYTPALTLRGLFLQFLTFFSSNKVEQEYGGYVYIGDHIIVQYARESGLPTVPQTPISYRSYYAANGAQDRLEKAWNSDKRPEIILSNKSGSVVDKTKDPKPSPARLHRLEFPNPRWASTLAITSGFKCKLCPYGSKELPHHNVLTPVKVKVTNSLSVPPSSCLLDSLDDDVLYTLISHLPSESIITFSQAYPRFRLIVETYHELLKRELTCFYLRTSLKNSVLGIGIHMDPQSRALSSDFDWLSEEAFKTFTSEKASRKGISSTFSLSHSAPSTLNGCKPRIWAGLFEIDQALCLAWANLGKKTCPPREMHLTVVVIYQMMNNIVVSLMKSCDDVFSGNHEGTLLHASEKAVLGYCHLFHLLISLSRSNPGVLRDAANRVASFARDPAQRHKDRCPDLGELIVRVTLFNWGMLNGPFLEETVIRNVRWVLKALPELEVLETGRSDYRLAMTFMHSKTSLRLMMFQITFLDLFERMVEQIKEIYNVNTWPGFFDRVRYTRATALGAEKFSDMLRSCLKTSLARKYHSPCHPTRMESLKTTRKTLEEQWVKTKGK